MKFEKKNLIMDICNVLAMMKLEECDGRDIFIEGIGNYHEIDKERIKKSSVSFSGVFTDDDIIYDTGRTLISGRFVNMAKRIMESLDHSWDFKVYENENKDYPLLLVEEYSKIGFFIAPRDRKWKGNERKVIFPDDVRKPKQRGTKK